MINFRFHIISLTAVFLSFAVGLLLGTNFLADASKNYLEERIDHFSDLLSDEKATNSGLVERIDSLESEDEQLDEQLGERLFDGELSGEPVLVLAPRGLEGDPGPVERVLDALGQANADRVGVWWFTDRLVLDDGEEVSDLAGLLDVDEDEPAGLRSTLSARLGDVLSSATEAPGTPAPALAAARSEPDLVSQLAEAGFVDYELPDGVDEDAVLLPSSGLRVVVVSGQGAALTGDQMLLPIVARMAEAGPAPVVVAETPIVPDENAEDDPVEPLVAQIRAGGSLSDRIATVDDLDRVSGRVATVLALADAAPSSPVVGHYGVRPDADRLLPAPPE